MSEYVAGATRNGCGSTGCQMRKAVDTYAMAEQMIRNLTRSGMSQALWCDQGGHAFSERDPGRQRISVTVLDDETEQEKQETRDFCGDCARQSGLLAKRKTRPALQDARPDGN